MSHGLYNFLKTLSNIHLLAYLIISQAMKNENEESL